MNRQADDDMICYASESLKINYRLINMLSCLRLLACFAFSPVKVYSQVLTRSHTTYHFASFPFLHFFFFNLFYRISHLPIPHKPPSTPLHPNDGAGPRLGLPFSFPFSFLSLPNCTLPFNTFPFHTCLSLSLTYSYPSSRHPPLPPSPRSPPSFFSIDRIEIKKRRA